MYKHWIFDWSGTLVDDLALVVSATNHVMQHYQKPLFERESFRESFCLPYAEFYEEILPEVPLEDIEERFREGFAISNEAVPVLPHAAEFLELLQQHGHSMYILTSMDQIAFEQQQQDNGLYSYFKQTYSGVLDKRELIHTIIAEHQLDHTETVFLGDMVHDIETAHHGGIASIALETGYDSAERLSTANPTMLVSNLSALRPLVVSS